MIEQILYTIGLSAVSGVLYRLGGIGKPFDTKFRDLGCPFIAVVILWLVWGIAVPIWVHILSFGLMFGAMTTYNKWIGKFFGYGDSDVYWISWLVTGILYGFAVIPYGWYLDSWVGFIIRIVVLGLSTMWWSEFVRDVNLEEGGRGFLFTATLPLLMIGG